MESKKVVVALSVLFLILVVIFLLGKPSTTGYIIKNNSLNHYLDNPDEAMAEYNKNIENVPGFIKTIFGNERINAEITLEDGTVREYGIITQGGLILNVSKEYLEDHSLEVYTDEETANNIMNSEDQVAALKQALDDKTIDYKAIKFTTKAKTFLAKIGLTLFGWFT